MDYSNYMLPYPGKNPVCKGHLKYANHADYRAHRTPAFLQSSNSVYVTSIADNRNNIPSVNDSSTNAPYYAVRYPSDIPNTYMMSKRRNSIKTYEMNSLNTVSGMSDMDSASYPTVPASADLWSDHDMDMSYFISVYPKEMRQLMLAIEKELDQYDSEDSFLYDEYPDQTTLYQIATTIYNKLKDEMNEIKLDTVETMQLEKNELPYPVFVRDWFFNTIVILMYNDILSRRRNRAMRYFV